MTEDEAKDLRRCLLAESHGDLESAEMVTDDVHGWGIELLWRQGASSYGCRLWTLESVVSGGVVSSYQAAVDVSMFVIEEPHGPLAHWDAEGRYWFPDDDDRLPDGVVSQASEQFWVKRFT